MQFEKWLFNSKYCKNFGHFQVPWWSHFSAILRTFQTNCQEKWPWRILDGLCKSCWTVSKRSIGDFIGETERDVVQFEVIYFSFSITRLQAWSSNGFIIWWFIYFYLLIFSSNKYVGYMTRGYNFLMNTINNQRVGHT